MIDKIRDSKMFRREILFSILIIGFAGTALGSMTWSYYEDSDSAGGNSLRADAMDLRIDGSDSVSGSFSIVDGGPGDSTSHVFSLTNNGGTAADHVEVSFGLAENDPASEPGDPDLGVELTAKETASLIRVTTLEYVRSDGTVQYDAIASMTDGNGNGVIDLEDVKNQEAAFDDLEAPQTNGGTTTKLSIAVQFVSDDGSFVKGGNTAGNLTGYDEDAMADGIDVTVTVTLNQDATQ
ncbi:hypothetical protein [Halosimplex aquaticum]|nr:hypothetical protein [Halosimplex aquaticum]